MTQLDRIEALLRTVLSNQVQLAILGKAAATKNPMGTSAAYSEVQAAAKNAIEFSIAEQKVHG